MNPDAKRSLGIALLKARADCCDCCRALVYVRERMAEDMNAEPPQPESPVSDLLTEAFANAGFTPAGA